MTHSTLRIPRNNKGSKLPISEHAMLDEAMRIASSYNIHNAIRAINPKRGKIPSEYRNVRLEVFAKSTVEDRKHRFSQPTTAEKKARKVKQQRSKNLLIEMKEAA